MAMIWKALCSMPFIWIMQLTYWKNCISNHFTDVGTEVSKVLQLTIGEGSIRAWAYYAICHSFPYTLLLHSFMICWILFNSHIISCLFLVFSLGSTSGQSRCICMGEFIAHLIFRMEFGKHKLEYSDLWIGFNLWWNYLFQ